MSEENDAALPLTSVELLDAAVWREIDSEEPQPAAAFLEALSRLIGRWLMVRSDAPGMDVVTVLCKARGYYRTPGGARMEKLIRFIATPLCHCAKFCSALWRSRKPLGQRENIGTPLVAALRYAEHEIP